MAEEGGGGGFGWGFVLGLLIGGVAGAYLASGPGREHVDSLRMQTIELTGRGEEFKARARAAAEKARSAVNEGEHPIGKALQEGVAAARKRRRELEGELESDASTGPQAGS